MTGVFVLLGMYMFFVLTRIAYFYAVTRGLIRLSYRQITSLIKVCPENWGDTEFLVYWIRYRNMEGFKARVTTKTWVEWKMLWFFLLRRRHQAQKADTAKEYEKLLHSVQKDLNNFKKGMIRDD